MRKTIITATATLLLVLPAASASAAVDKHQVIDPANGPIAGAWAKVQRGSDGIKYQIHTNGLAAGHAITLWVIAFNNPGACTHPMGDFPCGHGDLGPAAASSVALGGAIVPTANDRWTTSGTLSVGEPVTMGPPLTNPDDAAVVLVVLDHGVYDPNLDGQLSHPEVCNGPCIDDGIALFKA